MTCLRACLAVALLLLPFLVHADSWRPPVPITATSDNGLYRLTIYPRFQPQEDDADDAPGSGLTACEAVLEMRGLTEYEEVWRRPLVNAVSPVSALVANDGRFVTFDNWYGEGYGDDAIVLYRADATVVRQQSVQAVIGEDWYQRLPRSTLSVLWQGGTHRIYNETSQLELAVGWPDATRAPYYRSVVLDMDSGEVLSAPALQ